MRIEAFEFRFKLFVLWHTRKANFNTGEKS